MKTLYTYILCTFLFVNVGIISAQLADYNKSNELRRESIKKYIAKDYQGFLESTLAASNLRKNHPTLLYNTAIGFSLTNKEEQALIYLNQLADMKLYFQADQDSDFVTLWNNDRFKEISEKFNSAKEHIGGSEFVFSLHEKDLLTESVAYNPETQTFYVGSVHKRKIFSVSGEGNETVFAESKNDDFGGVFGIKVDIKHNLLWACTGFLPQMINYNEDNDGKSAVIKFDLNSGNILNKYELNEGKHLFGDLVIDSKGNVYVSDSRDNNIYVIASGSEMIQPFLVSDNFASLQGIDFSNDGSYLFAADYAMGLYRIDMLSKNISSISIPDNFTDLGIDGLYFYKNSLIAIQNGVNPQRVIRLNLDEKYSTVVSWSVIEANNKHFFEPTLGVLNGNDFYYIANSQWPNFNDDGTIAPEDQLKKPVILKTKLK